MINKTELNQLIAWGDHGPIPVDIVKNTQYDRIYINITNDEYVKASEKIMNHELRIKELTEFKEWANAQLDADRRAFANIQNTSNRREVTFLQDHGNDKPVTTIRGWLLAWGTQKNSHGEEYPVGIVEVESNLVETPYATDIKFENWTKEEKNEA